MSLSLKVGQNLDLLLLIGGRGKTDLATIAIGTLPSGDCSLIPHVPFEPLLSIGLRDAAGRAMVCGGARNPNQKSCVVLDRPSNQWLPGPSMKRTRVGAHATCLDSGVWCVFG